MLRRLPLVLVALTLLAPACGGPSPGEVVAQAAEKTEDRETSRVFFEGTAAVGDADPVSFTGEGTADYESRRAQLSFDMSELFGQAGARLEGADEVETIADGSVLYMKAAFFRQLIPGIKPWLKIDYKAAAEAQGIDLSDINQLGRNDPLLQLAFLEGATKVEEKGTEEIRGASTTRYEMTVDLKEVAAAVPPELSPQFEQLIEATGEKTLPVDVWIDDDGVARRVRYSFEVGNTPSGQTGKTTATMELYDFGIESDIEPPPENQTTDFLKLLEERGAFDE